MENEISTIEQRLIENQAREVIRTCYDPEIPVNIFDLGLVYEVKANELGDVHVLMTLTSPHCPAAQVLPKEVETKVKSIAGVRGVNVEVTWTPAWNPSMMSEAAKLELGF
jgi:FeS assembly SUF system protein